MNRVLLLGINARYSHSNPALFYLKKSISDLGLRTTIAEFTTGETPEKITGEIQRLAPDILAVSVYIWNSLHVKKILETLKTSLPDMKIVLGGPEVSFNSEEWMAGFSGIDFIITGGGEAAFRELAASGFVSGRKIISGSNPHFSLIHFPYNSEDMNSLKGKYIYYESSRGCPFNCSYCLSSVKNERVEYRETDTVKRELDFFSSYRLPLIKFVDRTFNLNKNHYMPVWEYIVKKFSGSGTCFHFEIFPELLDSDDLDFLSEVPHGLFQFEMGIQSTNAETLKEINRGGSWTKAEKNIGILARAGNIHLHTDLIAGLPYERFEDYGGSFNKVYSLGAEHFQGGFLKVLPGTEMHRKAAEYSLTYNPLPPYEIIENRWLAISEVEKLKSVGELVDLLHNSGRFTETEKSAVPLFSTPFSFYERLAEFFLRDTDARHRRWEYLAGILISMIKEDRPDSLLYLIDCLRWDWCCFMKHHHFPDLLKSDSTVEAKKTGYRFMLTQSESGTINVGEISFSEGELRRSIFFSPDSEDFLKQKMEGAMAMFLPDKRVLFFNPD